MCVLFIKKYIITYTYISYEQLHGIISRRNLCSFGYVVYPSTGQMGKSPFINVWDIETVKLRSQLGKGFFERQVCCLAFSPDGSRIVAVSGDDHHMMGT